MFDQEPKADLNLKLKVDDHERRLNDMELRPPNFKGRRLQNVGDPRSSSDAVTLQHLKSELASLRAELLERINAVKRSTA